MRLSVFISISAIFLAAALVGCSSQGGRPPTYPVSGSVTWKGKPVPSATVVLVPMGGGLEQEPATGVTDAAGKFQLTTYSLNDGAHAGEYLVKVSQYDAKLPTSAEKKEFMTMEEEQKLTFPGQELPTPPSKNLLPKKYESESTSGLVHTVTKGPSTLEISLQ